MYIEEGFNKKKKWNKNNGITCKIFYIEKNISFTAK